jgi:hypothetical protein
LKICGLLAADSFKALYGGFLYRNKVGDFTKQCKSGDTQALISAHNYDKATNYLDANGGRCAAHNSNATNL